MKFVIDSGDFSHWPKTLFNWPIMKERIQSIKDTLSRHCHPAEHTIADLNKVVVVVVVVVVTFPRWLISCIQLCSYHSVDSVDDTIGGLDVKLFDQSCP